MEKDMDRYTESPLALFIGVLKNWHITLKLCHISINDNADISNKNQNCIGGRIYGFL